jgi:hypothetical protein
MYSSCGWWVVGGGWWVVGITFKERKKERKDRQRGGMRNRRVKRGLEGRVIEIVVN